MQTNSQGKSGRKLAQSMVWKLDSNNILSATLVGPKGGEQYMTTCYEYLPPYGNFAYTTQGIYLVKDKSECANSDNFAEVILTFVQDRQYR